MQRRSSRRGSNGSELTEAQRRGKGGNEARVATIGGERREQGWGQWVTLQICKVSGAILFFYLLFVSLSVTLFDFVVELCKNLENTPDV